VLKEFCRLLEMEEQHSLPGAMIDTTAPEAEMQPACTEAETQPVDSSEVPHFSEEVFADVFAAFYRNPPTWDFEAVGRFKITDSTKVKDMRPLILEVRLLELSPLLGVLYISVILGRVSNRCRGTMSTTILSS